MADSKKKSGKGKSFSLPSIFRGYGKYFLILVLVIGQAFVAYSVVNKNYEAIYGHVEDLIPEERGQFEFQEIIVNPAGTNGQRYLLVQLTVELVDKEVQSQIEQNRSKIRNNLIKHLSAKTVPEIQGIKGKENLRLELIKIINETIDSRSVRNLYYSKYVMQ